MVNEPKQVIKGLKALAYNCGAKNKEYISDAIEALNKQIPKNPIKRKNDEFKDGHEYRCPNCNDSLATNWDDTYYNWWLSYCNSCGQAIDLSEVK